MKYTNTTRTTSMSEYVKVEPSVDGTALTFRSDKKAARINGIPLDFVNGSVRVVMPKQVSSCESECTTMATESVELKFNIVKGSSVDGLKAELDRVFVKAVAEMHLLDGIVPATHATFADE